MKAAEIGMIARGIIIGMNASAPDDAVRKRGIMIAREEGVLSEAEAERWLATLELRAA